MHGATLPLTVYATTTADATMQLRHHELAPARPLVSGDETAVGTPILDLVSVATESLTCHATAASRVPFIRATFEAIVPVWCILTFRS